MSLQGDLKDFSISNILPILKTEGKTGILQVKSEEKTVYISFQEGHIVYAHAGDERLTKRLESTLINSGLITKEGWRLLEGYVGSPELLWANLAKVASPDTASRLLRRQVTDTVFDLLRFKKGAYVFNQVKTVPFPEGLISPMDVDFLLMEGARIVDEFSQMETKLPKPTTMLRLSILDDEEQGSLGKQKREIAQLNFTDTLEYVVLQERGITTDEHEEKLLLALARPRSLADLVDCVDLSDFEALMAVLSLLKKHLIVEMSRKEIAAADKPEAARFLPGYYFLGFVAALTLFSLYHRISYMHPTQMKLWKRFSEVEYSFKVRQEMERIVDGMRIYHLQTGTSIQSLDQLVQAGIFRKFDLKDPWGNPYQFRRKDNSFLLFSLGADGSVSGDDVFFVP